MRSFFNDHSESGTCYTHSAHMLQIQQRKRRLQYHSSGSLDKCSFLRPAQFFPITYSSLENSVPSGLIGGRTLLLNWRPQLNSSFLILLCAWPPFLPEGGKPLALNSIKKKKKTSPNPRFKKLKYNKRYCKGSTTAYGCLLMFKPSMLVNFPSTRQSSLVQRLI